MSLWNNGCSLSNNEKAEQKAKQPQDNPAEPQAEIANNSSTNYLPRILLALSWAGFITYFIWQ
ncbi:DUF2956 family protein [Paraglaciecola mesophila]|nr:DUF2956 family protein [Paraglaciecola mesophila]